MARTGVGYRIPTWLECSGQGLQCQELLVRILAVGLELTVHHDPDLPDPRKGCFKTFCGARHLLSLLYSFVLPSFSRGLLCSALVVIDIYRM